MQVYHIECNFITSNAKSSHEMQIHHIQHWFNSICIWYDEFTLNVANLHLTRQISATIDFTDQKPIKNLIIITAYINVHFHAIAFWWGGLIHLFFVYVETIIPARQNNSPSQTERKIFWRIERDTSDINTKLNSLLQFRPLQCGPIFRHLPWFWVLPENV